MARMRVLFRCIGEAILCKGPKALCSLVPFGEVIYEVASDTWERLQKTVPRDERSEAIASVARASIEEARAEAESVVGALHADNPMSLEARINLVSYLTQVPCSVRQSLKRPADSTGRTVPPAFVLERAEQLVPMLPARLPSFKSGDRPAGIGNWELVELLGSGGFGEVWKARHPTLAGIPPVALKFCLDPATSKNLRHEAELLDRVMQQSSHPGIVPLRQAYLDRDPLCLEYEYIPGGDLVGAINDWHGRGKRSVRQINRMLLQLSEIIAHAHRLNPPIVHRDLKPANILVQKGFTSANPLLKVTDFGIGGVAATKSLSTTKMGEATRGQTLSTSLRGAHTPLYASPQQVKGDGPDPRDDVHALGVIWYQMLTGDLTNGVPADWATVLQDLGQFMPLIQLLGECVTSRLDKRLRNAGLLAERLRSELDGENLLEVLPADPPLVEVLPEVEPIRKRPTKRRRSPDRPLREPMEARPAEKPRSGNQVRHYSASGLRLKKLHGALERWLLNQGFNVQDLLTENGATLIQIAQQSAWRKLMGMASALNIILDQQGDELTVEIGAGQWMDKAAVGAVSLFVLWPLAVTAAIGAWNQMKLPEQIFTHIADHIDRQYALPESAPAGLSANSIARLKELKALHDQGVLTEEEFQAEKKRLLGK